MIDVRIDGLDQLSSFVEEDFKGRIRAVMRLVLRDIADRVFKQIVKGIPRHYLDKTEKWIKVYRESMDIFEISDLPKNEFGLAIASRVSGDWMMVDAETMIVYFDALEVSPDREIGLVLEKYGPFAVDQVPHLEAYGARPVARFVRQDEIEEVRRKNTAQKEELREALLEEGASFRSGPAKIMGTVYFDMVFAVMRMELGYGPIKKAHWRPALRKIGLHLNRMVRDVKLQRKISSMFNPLKVEWKDELKPAYRIMRVKDLNAFEDFQTRVYPSIF